MKNRSALLLAAVAALACNPGHYFEKYSENIDTQEEVLSHGMIVLGDQLEDPYSVDNITRALQALYPTRAADTPVETTDYYVRFLPENDAQFERLVALGLELSDHPVDYEIVCDGDYYHDPALPEDRITWQYAVVPAHFEYPQDIRYEVLDRVHIAEHKVVTRADGIDWTEVERESFRLTGNGAMLEPATRASDSPSGRISIVDERLDSEPIGVAGVRVTANVFVKISSAYTDEEGYYHLSRSFSAQPRYRLVFKNRKGFCLGVNLILVPASTSTLGRHSNEGVSVVVRASSDRKLFTRCVVNNAGYNYFESCDGGDMRIKRPPSNLRVWLFRNMTGSSCLMLQQGAGIDNTLVGKFLGEYATVVKRFLPDITLGLKNKEDYATIYASAVHEFAHASHYMQVGNEYWDKLMEFVLTSFITSGGVTYGAGTEKNHGYCEVGEMWAYYMQTRFFRDRYPDTAASFGTSFWFSPQIFYYLDERGLNRFRIFAALTSDVHDRETLQQRLLNLYPEYKNVINQAFSRY
ncbi:MAG: hypothetical protein IJV01_06490 [Bacteroidales bacterium]|nr:hypothetical protein [Bacteroidales bacterium]